MRRATIEELRDRASELVRDAENGEVIIIERQGRPVAELGPRTQEAKQPPLPDLTELWNSMPQLDTDSGKFLEEDR